MSHKMIRRCLANRSRVAAALGWTIVIYLIAPSAADLAGLLPAWSSREARIHQALAGKTLFDFSERPLAEAVDDIARRHGIEVLLDRKVLAEEGIACDTPITCQVTDVSLRSALRLAFDDLDLTYVVRDGYLAWRAMEPLERPPRPSTRARPLEPPPSSRSAIARRRRPRRWRP